MLKTIEEIQQQFNEGVSSKIKAGLRKQQAESVAARQIVRDAQAELIDEKAAKQFIIAVEVAKGTDRAAAEALATSLFDGGSPKFFETDERRIPQAGQVPGV